MMPADTDLSNRMALMARQCRLEEADSEVARAPPAPLVFSGLGRTPDDRV